jgi:hypothetical protein
MDKASKPLILKCLREYRRAFAGDFQAEGGRSTDGAGGER